MSSSCKRFQPSSHSWKVRVCIKEKLLTYSWFTRLCLIDWFVCVWYSWFTRFHVYCKVIQLCLCVSIFFFRFFSIIGYYRILNIVSPPLTSGDRPSRQKVSKVTEILTDTIEQLYFIDICRSLWASLVTQMLKNTPAVWETWVQSLDWEDPLEKGMATHSRILAWRIPWTEKPDRLQFMGSQS